MNTLTRSLAIVSTLAIAACSNSSSNNQTAQTGDVAGQAMLDSAGTLTPPFSGITVSLEGTNFSATTDDSGRFEMTNVPSGEYTIRWSKTGYGYIRGIGLSIPGGGNTPVYVPPIGSEKLRKFATIVTTLKSVTVDSVNSNLLTITGSYNDPENPISSDAMILYYSHSSNVSPVEGNYDGFTYIGGPDYYPDYNPAFDTATKTFNLSFALIPPSFHSGDSIYFATYGAPDDIPPYGDYYDPATNTYVYTSYNQTPSPVIGIKIP